jgi:predicted nucleic acid-binding Zn ribbon protein
MSLNPLGNILDSIKQESRWQEQPMQRILQCWVEVVGTAVATHTRPVSIQRQILWVATSSAVWAHELSFRRQRILEKLNTQLPQPLLDIRFSSAQWQQLAKQESFMSDRAASRLGQDHPSWVGKESVATNSDRQPRFHHPQAAFQHWIEVKQKRSRHLPLCPQCHCHTPVGELERWGVCSICAAKQW